ncbi:MAG: hypothetical protein DMG78_24770 [Acidobacteria bacterium]|nr:MAG: hypothetical protein DMG78_24770 [Acidobacteriota bacterium]
MVALGLYSPFKGMLRDWRQSCSLAGFALFERGEERFFDVRKYPPAEDELLILHITSKGSGRLADVLFAFRISQVIAELLEIAFVHRNLESQIPKSVGCSKCSSFYCIEEPRGGA